jgi:hypothetical protein
VADTLPGRALLPMPAVLFCHGGQHTRACTVAGDEILDYLVVLLQACSDALINTSLATHISGIVRSLFRPPIENGRVLR